MHNQTPCFTSILKSSLERNPQIRAWCDKCRRYRYLNTRTTLLSAPPVLIINTGLDKSPEGKQLWARPNWLPEKIGLLADGRHVSCHEGEYLRVRNATKSSFQQSLPVYELVGMVADINSGEHQKPHLVSIVNGSFLEIARFSETKSDPMVMTVAISETNPIRQNKWHLLNDFLVREIPTIEALQFSTSWKMPVTLVYQIKTFRHAIDDSWKQALDTSCLYYEKALSPTYVHILFSPVYLQANHLHTASPSRRLHLYSL